MTDRIAIARRARTRLPPGWAIAVAVLFLLMSGFVAHSARLGIGGLIADLSGKSRFYAADAPIVTAIMFLHMVTGAALTLLAPLQLLGAVRRRWRGYHRWAGRTTVGLGAFTSIGAIVFALSRGTLGGPMMDASSTVYGLLMITSAVQTYRFGRARDWPRHRRWGWRLAVLVIASWLYRMHYVVWDWLTGGIWTTPDVTGPFDVFQLWAFYLSYLALLEAYFAWEGRRRRSARLARKPAPRPIRGRAPAVGGD